MTPKLSGHSVGGAVRFVCTDSPSEWTATLYLEYRSSSNIPVWEEVDTDEKDDPGHALFLYGGCRVGDWQLRYVVTGAATSGAPILMQGSKEEWISQC